MVENWNVLKDLQKLVEPQQEHKTVDQNDDDRGTVSECEDAVGLSDGGPYVRNHVVEGHTLCAPEQYLVLTSLGLPMHLSQESLS